MKFLDHFSLPYSGMKNGLHHYEFDISSEFFHEFGNLPVSDGAVSVKLEVDKRSTHSIVSFEIYGSVFTQCDRCLADIHLPISGHYTLHFKTGQGEDDDEVVFLPEDVTRLNVSRYIYEFICLSVPVMKVYDCRNDDSPPCDMAVLRKLGLLESRDEELKTDTGLQDLADLFKS